LNISRWYRETNLPIFLFVHWSPTHTKQSSSGKYIVFFMCDVFFSNQTGPFCTHVSKQCLQYVFCQKRIT
jgi:hypothetical protein